MGSLAVGVRGKGKGFSKMDDDGKSRTQKKHEDRALQELGKQLVGLSSEQLANIDVPAELLEAVMVARETKKRGAKRRQMQYIGRLMREIDAGPVRHGLENIRRGDLDKARSFHKIEQWRDAIKAGQEQVVEEILASCPGAERKRLTQLARNARHDAENGKGVKSSRVLFRYLKEVAGP
ncbi:MAG: ribosome biogenesis factor YjgA [Thermodesulfobacteriota bacterium]|nr:ribosome biogenesis factor YjgA [Thermodesulfobacteriota bacterium]